MYHSIKRTLLFEIRKKFYEKDAWHHRASSQATTTINFTFCWSAPTLPSLFTLFVVIPRRQRVSNKRKVSRFEQDRLPKQVRRKECQSRNRRAHSRDNITEHEETNDPRDNPFFPQPFNNTSYNGLSRRAAYTGDSPPEPRLVGGAAVNSLLLNPIFF